MEGEFIVVGKKGKPKKSSNRKHSHKETTQIVPSVKTSSFAYNTRGSSRNQRVEGFKNKWETSLFSFHQLQSNFYRNEVRKSKLYSFASGKLFSRLNFAELLKIYLSKASDTVDVVCYGIGNFLESKNSLYQLSFIVCLWEAVFLQVDQFNLSLIC